MSSYQQYGIKYLGKGGLFLIGIHFLDQEPDFGFDFRKEWTRLFRMTDPGRWLDDNGIKYRVLLDESITYILIPDEAQTLLFKATWGVIHAKPQTVAFR